MRLGLMVGPERGRCATKVERMLGDAKWAQDNGLSSIWIPQIPDEFDAMTAAALVAHSTSRIEIGTAVVALQTRHPVALVQQALSTQLVAEGRFTLGVGPSHHWIVQDMLGLPYDRPAALTADYLDVLDAAMAGPGVVEITNDSFRINNPMYVTDAPRMPVLLAALGPVMLRLAGSRTDGTILWLADEKAIESHIAPRIHEAAASTSSWRAVRAPGPCGLVSPGSGGPGPGSCALVPTVGRFGPHGRAAWAPGMSPNVTESETSGDSARPRRDIR